MEILHQQSAFHSLPKEWQQWITENLARACEPDAMAEIMARDGHFEKNLAHAAVSEALQLQTSPAPVRQPRPEINTALNTIATTDRAVDILFALNMPRIVLLGNVLSHEECDALVQFCEPRLLRSPVVDDHHGTQQLHVHRTSQGAMLQKAETALIARIEARLAEIASWPIDHGEGMQVLRYEAGNEYRAHFDWFDPNLPGPRKHLEHGGQRLATFVIYLSDVEEGGGTSFPALGLEVYPKKCGAVFFANTNHHGTPDRQTLHAGMPVVKGVKFVANKWLRERKY